jgi:transposase-like protein
VLAGLCGDRSVKDVCREHEISDTLFYSWRDKTLEGGREALSRKEIAASASSTTRARSRLAVRATSSDPVGA